MARATGRRPRFTRRGRSFRRLLLSVRLHTGLHVRSSWFATASNSKRWGSVVRAAHEQGVGAHHALQPAYWRLRCPDGRKTNSSTVISVLAPAHLDPSAPNRAAANNADTRSAHSIVLRDGSNALTQLAVLSSANRSSLRVATSCPPNGQSRRRVTRAPRRPRGSGGRSTCDPASRRSRHPRSPTEEKLHAVRVRPGRTSFVHAALLNSRSIAR